MKLRKKPQNARRPHNSSSAGVFSYYSKARTDSVSNAGRGTETIDLSKKYQRWHYIPTYLALLLITVASLYALWLKPDPKVIIIGKPNTIFRPATDYQNTIQDIWKNSLLNQSKLTLNSAKLTTELEQKFPELASIKIELPLLGQRPTVVITPSEPAMKLTNAQGSYYVSHSGKVLADVDEVQSQELSAMPTVTDASQIPADTGSSLLPEPHIQFITRVYAYLTAAKIPIESMTLPANAAHELHVKPKGKGYYLKFSLLTDPKQAVGAFIAAKSKISPNSYVDLRVAEKLFYK